MFPKECREPGYNVGRLLKISSHRTSRQRASSGVCSPHRAEPLCVHIHNLQYKHLITTSLGPTRSLPSVHQLNCSFRSLTTAHSLRSAEKVAVTFVGRDGERLKVKGHVGDSLLKVVVDQKLDIDGFGACEGTLACSTCHLVLEDSVYQQLDSITDEEMDLLDLSSGLTETSRLGCQVCLTKELNGMTVRVPDGVNDIRQMNKTGSSS
ncbi:adrenodoxin-like [Engraulis encrasicolus]|uniref:adrenodoxin-like n=1 Tax=Engraulis encrasicolus TaxID=184585 RepID=UPI002FD26CEE